MGGLLGCLDHGNFRCDGGSPMTQIRAVKAGDVVRDNRPWPIPRVFVVSEVTTRWRRSEGFVPAAKLGLAGKTMLVFLDRIHTDGKPPPHWLEPRAMRELYASIYIAAYTCMVYGAFRLSVWFRGRKPPLRRKP